MTRTTEIVGLKVTMQYEVFSISKSKIYIISSSVENTTRDTHSVFQLSIYIFFLSQNLQSRKFRDLTRTCTTCCFYCSGKPLYFCQLPWEQMHVWNGELLKNVIKSSHKI